MVREVSFLGLFSPLFPPIFKIRLYGGALTCGFCGLIAAISTFFSFFQFYGLFLRNVVFSGEKRKNNLKL